jgi:hypothetical protein
MKFEVSFEMDNTVSTASIDSMREQLTEVIAAAVEDKQIEIPEAEIIDYEVTPNNEPGFLD